MKDAGYPPTRNPLGVASLAGVRAAAHFLILLLPLTMALGGESGYCATGDRMAPIAN
jgi:hypothetical protein